MKNIENRNYEESERRKKELDALFIKQHMDNMEKFRKEALENTDVEKQPAPLEIPEDDDYDDGDPVGLD